LPSSRPIDRFTDILRNIDAIASYTKGMDEEQFFNDRKTYDACERCLSRISEAAIKLGDLAEQLAPDQPWNDIRGIGNWLRHDYPDIAEDTIWKTIAEDLQPLRGDCERVLQKLKTQKSTDAKKD
jgi:uncharacterized protein with HEPN domain